LLYFTLHHWTGNSTVSSSQLISKKWTPSLP